MREGEESEEYFEVQLKESQVMWVNGLPSVPCHDCNSSAYSRVNLCLASVAY